MLFICFSSPFKYKEINFSMSIKGGDKNTRNKSIEFDDEALADELGAHAHADAENTQAREHAESADNACAGNAGDACADAENAGPDASPREGMTNVPLTTTTSTPNFSADSNNNNNTNINTVNKESKVVRQDNAGYFSMLTSAVCFLFSLSHCYYYYYCLYLISTIRLFGISFHLLMLLTCANSLPPPLTFSN